MLTRSSERIFNPSCYTGGLDSIGQKQGVSLAHRPSSLTVSDAIRDIMR